MRRVTVLILASCVLALLPDSAARAASLAAAAEPAAQWRPVDAARLDAARGGFQLPSGLAVGLGIERTVALNGALVTQTRFAIADVRALTADQATQAQAALASVQLIRNGQPATLPAPGATGATGPTTLTGATFIQNSLDNQRIQSLTTIDASVNTLGSLKALNFSSTVLDALTRAATSR